jgi:glycogen(starch) synthase
MTTDTVGGVFVYCLELIRALRERGVEVVLAALGRRLSTQQRAALRRVDVMELHEHDGALEWMDDPWADVAATGAWLLELAARVRPDCIHLNEYAHGALAWPAPVVMVGHSDVVSWWQAVHGEAAPGRYDVYRMRVRAGLAAAECVVAPSESMLEALRQHYGSFARDPSLSAVIPNGIDARAFGPARKQPFILCAGRLWDAAKNLETLQRSADGLAWPIRLAGETSLGAEPQISAGRCRRLGHLSRRALALQLGAASIYALPARYEPFGLSVLEAAVSGCALVLGRIPSLLENWSDAALFVDPEDPDELRHTLAQLIAQPLLRGGLAKRARLRAQRFSATRMAEGYLQLYTAAAAAHLDRGARCAS